MVLRYSTYFHIRKIFASLCSKYTDLIPVASQARNGYKIMSTTSSKILFYKNVSSIQKMCFHNGTKAQHECQFI